MKKYITTLVFSVILTVAASAQVKIGYMNPNQVLSQLDEVAAIETQIDELATQRDEMLAKKATELQQDYLAYEEGKSVMAASAREQKEQELVDRDSQLQEEQQTYINEIRQRRAQLLQPIMERLDNAIQAVAKEQGLDLVLNEGTTYGDAIVFYTNDEKLNITAQVLERVKANNTQSN